MLRPLKVKITSHLLVSSCRREDRLELLQIHMKGTRMSLSRSDWQELLHRTDGYSGCDIANLISSALLEPIRDMVKATHWITTCCKYKNPFSDVRYIPENINITAKQAFLLIIIN